MKPFLLELAESIYAQHKRSLENVVVIFPNRRAAIYFQKYLTSLLDKPSFAPSLFTVEEFISSFTSSKQADKLQLIHRLHKVYKNVVVARGGDAPESFDKFFFWGEMLLKDFEEIDKYMVSAEHLFKDLSNQKELDSSFDYLTEEQRIFLQSFWANFEDNSSGHKNNFLKVWEKLGEVYAGFRAALTEERLGYEGLIHRQVAENIEQLATEKYKNGDKPSSFYFIGFNALTKAEERIISYFVANREASVYWDVDDYYINNQRQEAARFFQLYKDHPVLGNTFNPHSPANLKRNKRIDLFSAPQPIGQAKLMAQVLRENLQTGFNPEETIVVLPDEKLLMPVLHGISGDVEKLNVTMGFPLSSSPLFNFVELLVELQLSRKGEHFNHRPVLVLLGHPYIIAADAAAAHAKRKTILQENWVHVPENFVRSEVELHRKVFSPFYENEKLNVPLSIVEYLKSIVIEIGSLHNVSDFDKEYCFHFLRLLNRMHEVFIHDQTTADEIITESKQREALKSFLRLVRQIMKGEKIPFHGEPLKGLQVMGVLETRNLDFRNVFILSLNEGSFPSFPGNTSYIPYNIRKAYGLPTVEHQDSMYAYLFYRILQRAENIFLFYNSETDDLGQGEMSRYLQQLIYESGMPIRKHTLHNELRPMQVQPLVVQKDERVFNELANYCSGSKTGKKLSPSALNDYLECRLKFYIKYVARIREADEVEEDLDARVLGNFVHQVMELFYQQIIDKKGTNTIDSKDFEGYEAGIKSLIDRVFIENYGLNKDKVVVYEGQRLVVREIVKRFVYRIINIDKQYAPFTIEALEKRDLLYSITVEHHGQPTVLLGGSIDRADKKENTVRVIDYKTGKDDLDFADVSSLFDRDRKRNKAAFQTLFYTLLYKKNLSVSSHLKFTPGLMNRNNLFNDDFTFGLKHDGKYLEDATPLLPDFENGIATLLDEMFDPQIPFDQTPNTEACLYCPYHQVCYR